MNRKKRSKNSPYLSSGWLCDSIVRYLIGNRKTALKELNLIASRFELPIPEPGEEYNKFWTRLFDDLQNLIRQNFFIK